MTPRKKATTPEPEPEHLEPRNLEVERSALGAALLTAAAADYLSDHLQPASFYRHAHALLFAAVRELRGRDQQVDPITLRQQLGDNLDECGGPAYISSLVEGMPRSANIGHYCAILEDLRLKRAIVGYGVDVTRSVQASDKTAKQLLGEADRRLLELQAGHDPGRMASVASRADALIAMIEYRMAHRGELLGLTTGFQDLNDLTLGWQAGDLNIIAARPSIGKTTFVLNTAVASALQGAHVAIFSLEMRRQQLEYRLLSQLSGIPLTQIITGNLMAADIETLGEAIGGLARLSIHIDDATGRTAWDIRSACRKLKAEDGLDLIIVDYVQLMAGSLERRGGNRTEEMTDISRRMKTLADEAGVPLLLLSQLSRAGEGRSDPRPKLSDLRESGALEQDADIVLFLHRKHHREGGPTELIVEKQRNGPTGSAILVLDRDTSRFTDAPAGTTMPVPTPEEKKAETKVKQQSFLKQARRRG